MEVKQLFDLSSYQASLEGAAFFPQAEAGCLRLSEADRIAFLQRQTTNDLRQLSPQRSVLTVLTSPAGRILDVLRVVQVGEAVLALTLPGHGADTFRYFKQRIFFMDKVTVEDASMDFAQVDVEGPQAGTLLQSLGFAPLPDEDEMASTEIGEQIVRLIGQAGLGGAGYRLLVPRPLVETIEQALLDLGAPRLSVETYHVLRVEAGLPASGAELAEAFTPLEVGLESAVSEEKGCYTGQEVLARQTTYDKVTQRLVRFRLEGPVLAGARLSHEGKPAGVVTSAAESPRFGQIGLGVVKRPYNEEETVLVVGEEGDARAVVI